MLMFLFLQVGRAIHKACNSVKAGMAPDEFILLTALRAHGYARSIQRVELKPGMRYPPGTLLNSYPTLVLFPAESSPHPVLWTDLDTKTECQVRLADLLLHTPCCSKRKVGCTGVRICCAAGGNH
jgi:hypothetical protein